MWQQLLVWVVTTVLSAFLVPRPKVASQEAQPGQLTDQEIPIASASAPIPVLFGTRRLSGPNVVWWGDVITKPIRKGGGGGGKK